MVEINTEGKIDFDYSISTEDRFALRNWFDNFVNALNGSDAEYQKTFLSDQLLVEGFTPESLDFMKFLAFWASLQQDGSLAKVRFPFMQVKVKNDSFWFAGNLEGFADNILSYEGSVEFEAVKVEGKFKLDYVRFYPRLMMRKS